MNVLREERLCNQYNSHEMEDLVHFLMKYNAYQNERADLIHIINPFCTKGLGSRADPPKVFLQYTFLKKNMLETPNFA